MEELSRSTAVEMETTIDAINDDLLHNILSRLPALACANAACVNRSWNLIITSLLSLPNLSSALSINPSLQDAVNEAVDKVLSKPIRPQFAIASVGPSFSLQQAHQLITGKLGSRIPIVTLISQGIFGCNAVDDEFKEVQWQFIENDEDHPDHVNENHGVLLTVGFLPGLKVSLIPLLSKTRGTQALMIDELVRNIRECSSSVSGSASPVAILLFSDHETDMKPVLQKLDYAFCQETVIVGEGGSQFLYQGEAAVDHSNDAEYSSAAVALSFLRDTGNPPEFHEVLRGDEEYLYVNGVGIRSGDSFQFYLANANATRDSCNNASNNITRLKRDLDHQNAGCSTYKKSVFGCLMFSCCGRGEFFLQPILDCSPFVDNFPGITFSGTFSAAEIARGDLSQYGPVSEERSSLRCCLHVYSTVYLIMSFTPASPST